MASTNTDNPLLPSQNLFYRKDSLFPQLLLVIATWLYLCLLHWDNDGLWFFDATQHAAHGFFWKDFLRDFTFKPIDYVLSYYARYPIIRPSRYPPAFYFPMALVYSIFGASPYVAKNLVLCFALMSALYTMAWCRRWIQPQAGWAGALILLLPIVVKWSHAVMLNVPVLALSIASLYHFRIWLSSPPDTPAWRHLYLSAILAVLSILTHVANCVIVLILFAWLLTARGNDLFKKTKTWLVVLASALALVPWFLIVLKYEMGRVNLMVGSDPRIAEPSRWHWFYYLKHAPSLFDFHVLGLAIIGAIIGLSNRRWRSETIRLLILSACIYLFYAYMAANDVRYIILLALPLVLFCTMTLITIIESTRKALHHRPAWQTVGTMTIIAFSFMGQGWMAATVPVPSISGYRELVQYMEKVAPNEPLFYDGRRDDIFAFYVRAGDPGFQRRAVCGNRLLYARNNGGPTKTFVSSPDDVIEMLQNKGGCHWIAIDEIPLVTDVNAPEYLRTAVQGSHFEWVKSFPIQRKHWNKGYEHTNVQLYRFLKSVQIPEEVEIPYSSQGKVVYYRTKPIER